MGLNACQARYLRALSGMVLVLSGFWGWAAGALAAETLSTALAARGHPDTALCQIEESRRGLGRLMVIQFKTRKDRVADLREATEILQILVPVLAENRVLFVGFDASKRWSKCRTRPPDLTFWRDHKGDWRLIRDKPVDYLQALHDRLAQEAAPPSAQAYALFSLAYVERGLGRAEVGMEHYQQAYSLLDRAGEDPNEIKGVLLIPLIRDAYSSGNEILGDHYLLEYARVAEQASDPDAEYLPLVKTSPVYPTDAFRARVTGEVLLEFTVDAAGYVIDPIVIEENPPDQGFGAAAIAAARGFRYIPRLAAGEFVPVEGVRNRIRFDIE